MKMIEQKILTELFSQIDYDLVEHDSFTWEYSFEIGNLSYLASIDRKHGDDIATFEVAFGVKDKRSKFRHDYVSGINMVDATDVVQTMIKIVSDHYTKFAANEGTVRYTSSPVLSLKDGKVVNKRLSLYKRQVMRTLESDGIDGVKIDITTGGHSDHDVEGYLDFTFIREPELSLID